MGPLSRADPACVQTFTAGAPEANPRMRRATIHALALGGKHHECHETLLCGDLSPAPEAIPARPLHQSRAAMTPAGRRPLFVPCARTQNTRLPPLLWLHALILSGHGSAVTRDRATLCDESKDALLLAYAQRLDHNRLIFIYVSGVDCCLVGVPAPVAGFAFPPAPAIAARIGAAVHHAALTAALPAEAGIGELYHQQSRSFAPGWSSHRVLTVPSG